MDWIGNQLSVDPGFGCRPETSFSFLYNYDHHRYPAGLDELKHPHETHEHGVGMAQNLDKKKRLTSEQLDSLEMSFQKEIKLDPDRKMVLAQELGLQPRQVAVWFQNRRARWKAKQLERLYDSLKKELDRVSMEKNQLQQEVMALRAMILNEDAVKKQTKCTLTCNSAGYTDVSCGEDTLERTSLVAIQSCNYMPRGTSIATTSNISQQNQHQVVDHGDNEGTYDVYMDDYYPVEITPKWGGVMP